MIRPPGLARITAKMLSDGRASPHQLEVFRAVFPNGAPLTLEAVAEARAAGLDVTWVACLLSQELQARYEAEMATLQKRECRDMDTLSARHRAEMDVLRASYVTQTDALLVGLLSAAGQLEGPCVSPPEC